MKLSRNHEKRQSQLWGLYGSGGGKQRRESNLAVNTTPIEAPNTLQSKTTARLIDVISEGEIEGLVNGAKSIYIDETPLQDVSGTYNFSGVTYEAKDGEADQDPLLGFSGVESEVEVGVQLVYNTPVIRQITDSEADAVRIKVRIPALYSQNLATGNVGPSQVFIQFQIQSNGGGYTNATMVNVSNPVEINGKTTSPYEVSYRLNLPAGGNPWDIRVMRANAEPAAGQQGQSFWSNYTIIKDVKLKYNNTALIGMTVDSSQFGSNLPARAYEVKGIKIQIPDNYNPTTRAYTGIWGGSFNTAYSNNPAWILYDMIINNRYGLGETVTAATVDKFALYAIGVYCDELVPDGFGNTEPRFVFNGAISSQQEAFNVLTAISSCFRGMTYWATASITAAMDAPTDITKLVTRSNVIGGQLEYSGAALKARHTVAAISYINPDTGYKPDIVVVEDPDSIAQFGWRQIDTVAYGCTSKGQAYRVGKWILDSEKYETETVTFRAGMDHFDIRPGHIIKVQDPHYAGIRYGGRMASISTTTVTLDSSVVLAADETYSISVVMPDGTIEDRDITNAAGTHTAITIESVFSQTPSKGAVWVITGSDVVPRQFRVLAVRETEKNIVEVSALFYDPNKYDRVENDITLETPSYSTLPTGALQPPSDIQFLEYLYQTGPSVKSAITASWTFSPDARAERYEVSFKPAASTVYQDIGATSGNSIDILDTESGQYDFRVRAVGGLGSLRSTYITATTSASGLLDPPGDVDGFGMQVINDAAYLSWDAVTDLDLAYYVIRFSPLTDGTATWGTSNLLISQVSKDATGISAPLMIGTYFIKAVDTSGIESVNATEIITNVAELQGLNVIVTLQEDPDFTGTCTDCSVLDGALQLTGADYVDDWLNVDDVVNWDIGQDGITDIGTYDFADYPGGLTYLDLGAVYTSRLTGSVTASGSDLYDNMDLRTDIDAISNWDGGDASQWAVTIFVRTTDDDPSGSPTWTAWTPLIVGDYSARAFQLKAVLYSYEDGISPVVTALSVTVDMPDRIIAAEDVVCPAGGSTITFDQAFKAIPAIAVTGQNLATGDYVTISAKSASGFTVRFFNAAGTGVERTMDWIAKGYGAVVP